MQSRLQSSFPRTWRLSYTLLGPPGSELSHSGAPIQATKGHAQEAEWLGCLFR